MVDKASQIRIPNITRVGEQGKKAALKSDAKQSSEFGKLLQKKLETTQNSQSIELSKHAAKRVQERDLQLDQTEWLKIRAAMGKLKSKGGQDSLVITGKGAYILDVPNQKIVTAMNKEGLKENVFTKIDSTIFMD